MALREAFLRRQRLRDLFKVISLRLAFTVLSFVLALYIFALLTNEIFIDRNHVFDKKVFQSLWKYTTPEVIGFMNGVTFFGKPEFLIPAYLFLIGVFIIFKRKKYAIETAIIGVSSTALLFGLKKLFARERPDIPILSEIRGYSFPSGHALLTFVFCSLLVYLIWSSHIKDWMKWSISTLLILFSLLVGISRIVLRVHYFTDVVAGFCLGYAWVIIALWVQRRFMKMRDKAFENENN